MTQDFCGHLLLREWAAWAGEQNVLGLPTRSTIERARQGGMERGACSPEGPMPAEIRKTDEAVAFIRQTNPLGWRVIKLYYLHGQNLGYIGQSLGVSRFRAQQQLFRAQKNVKDVRGEASQSLIASAIVYGTLKAVSSRRRVS